MTDEFYKCNYCGRIDPGTYERFEFEGYSISKELAHMLCVELPMSVSSNIETIECCCGCGTEWDYSLVIKNDNNT
jgi:hypothetical protein